MPRHPAPLTRRAASFSLCAGAVTLFLALLATTQHGVSLENLAHALVPAIACAVLSWAAAQERITGTAAAIDAAVARLAAAADGDLDAPVPASTRLQVPQLGVAMAALFAQLARNFARIEQLALFDPVTGLPNRPHFRREVEPLVAAPDHAGALFFIDLDRFKRVNDTRGHAAGDQLLAQVATRLTALAPSDATVGRLAGDEFTVFAPQLGAIDAQALGARIVAALSEPFVLPGGPCDIAASVGIALAPHHGTLLHDLMRAADIAMYHAKAAGRGRVACFDTAMAGAITVRDQLDRDLALALERGEFALVFQPQVTSDAGTMVCAEALLRWRHPVLGLRRPVDFLARAEESGQIVAIGSWVVETIAMAAAQWHRDRRPGRIALNLSRREVEHPGFVAMIGPAMAAAGAPLDRLELEICEELAMHCSAEVIAALGVLRAAGATIAIDDFGTGKSSVQALRVLPIDRVKLDPVLVHDVADDAAARTVVQSLIGLIHGLGYEAVAEGVECVDQAEVLRVIGCDAIQGYAVARPMSDAALARWTEELFMPERRRG